MTDQSRSPTIEEISERSIAQARHKMSDMPGLKYKELAGFGPCPLCRKPLLDPDKNSATFYVISVSRAMHDQHAIRRAIGLELQLGSPAIAQAMGPDEDLAKIFDGPKKVVVHEGCAGGVIHLLELMTPPGGGQ